MQPVFRRVMECFERPIDLATAVGESRAVIDWWLRKGVIPPQHAVPVSMATKGKVSAIEIVNEAHRAYVKRKARKELKAAEKEMRAVERVQEGAGE